jgi:hypothetical protein
VKALCEALQTNRHLRYLYLDANGLSVESAKHLAEYFRFKAMMAGEVGVTSLWIGINRLGDEGVQTLVNDGLAMYPHLERLTIGSNRFTDVGMDAIVNGLGTKQELQVLNVGFYKSTADMGELPNHFTRADHIVRVLSTLPNLVLFTANECGLTVEHLEEIASNVSNFASRKLCDINLSQAGVSLAPLDKMRSFLDSNCQNRGVSSNVKEYRARFKRLDNSGPKIELIDSIYRNNM